MEVNIEKFKGKLRESELCFIDGKYEATVVFFTDERLIFKAEASDEIPGTFICGAKYISPNQPLKIHSENGYFEGRISKIIHDSPS